MAIEHERGPIRRVADKAGLVFSFFSLPAWLLTAVGAGATGNFALAGGALAMAEIDRTQIVEHGKPPEKQRWYNPERIMDRVIGALRFGQPPTRSMVHATRPA